MQIVSYWVTSKNTLVQYPPRYDTRRIFSSSVDGNIGEKDGIGDITSQHLTLIYPGVNWERQKILRYQETHLRTEKKTALHH